MQTTKLITSATQTQMCDGYVRLTFCALLGKTFEYRRAWLDAQLSAELVSEGLPVDQAGYCEWLSDITGAGLSMGWAWFKLVPSAEVFLAPGGISTNVMLVTHKHFDMGHRKTQSLLRAWLSNQTWKPATVGEIFINF
jgi:Domain of unknown function (DUF4902)